MIEILTTNQKEYMQISRILREHMQGPNRYKPDIKIYKPSDCKAVVKWSIDDIRHYFPEDVTDDMLENALEYIENTVKNDMMDRGWDSIEELKDELMAFIPKTKEVY